MRQLASIQRVEEINPIEGADSIEQVRVLGWSLVAKKGEFNQGSKCCFFEIDSLLPEASWSEFMRRSKFRIKTRKMLGVLSQGLALPLSILPEDYNGSLEIGTDLTEVLNVKKYEPPQHDGGAKMGKSAGNFPRGVPKTDETRIQSVLPVLAELRGKPYYITVKCDGTSFTACYQNDEFLACSRRFAKKEDADNIYWYVVNRYDIRNKLENFKDFAIQGEIVSPGVQKNRMMVKEPSLFVFNVYNISNQKYLDFEDFMSFCRELDIPNVPIEEMGNSFNYTFEELLEKAEGYYEGTNKHREGIVVRPQTEMYSRKLKGRLSFKVINNSYLLKGGN